MPRRTTNPNQIIRKDGNNCFVEVLSNSFEIDRVLMKFVTYDPTKAAGQKFTNEIDIYLTFEQFLRLKYDTLDSQALIKRIMQYKKEADEQTKATGKKVYSKQQIVYQGGTSARQLEARGKARADGMSLSRTLKVFAGDKLPFIFLAEQGPGEDDAKGLIVPKYGHNPEQRVMLGLSADDIKELFLITEARLNAYLTAKQMWKMMNPEENATNTGNTGSAPASQNAASTYQQNSYQRNTAPTAPAAPVAPTAPAVAPAAPENDAPDFFPSEEDLFGGGADDFF